MKNRAGILVRRGYDSFERWRDFANSRKQAERIRKEIVDKKGHSFLDKKTFKTIREYASETFGSADYWPWLALYTEIREKFVEGWIPNEYYTFELIPVWNPVKLSQLSVLKSFDHRLFGSFSIEPLVVRVSGQYYDSKHAPVTMHEAGEILRAHDSEVVIKKDFGPSGKGIIFTESKKVDTESIAKGFDIVIQPSVKQHKTLSDLYPHSVNTFRVFTHLDENGAVMVKAVILRFGVGGSRIDNIMSGGCYLPFSGGSLGNTAYDGLGFETGEKHPDTGYRYDELDLPCIEKLISTCKEAHTLFPYLRFIGWDVSVDQSGEPKLIEWNANNPTIWRYEARVGPFWNQKPV